MQGLDFSVLVPFAGRLATGVYWTAVLTTVSTIASLVLGMGMALARLYAGRWLAVPVRFISWLFMSTPLLLQLFVIYYGLVQIGIDIPALGAGIIGLSLHFAVYNADVFRAGIVAVDPGQTEAARSIGLGRWRTLRHVVVPQAARTTMPAIGGNIIALLKESSIVSMIGITELVHAAQLGISETYRPFEFYITVAVLYYALNLILEFILRGAERKVERTR